MRFNAGESPYQKALDDRPTQATRWVGWLSWSSNNSELGKQNCQLLDEKMRSINFSTTKLAALPTEADLQSYYSQILAAGDPSAARERIIDDLTQRGIAFSGQEGDFCCLTSSSLEALSKFNRNPVFAEDNAALLKQLIPYLATPVVTASDDVNAFNQLLASLDIRNNLNELGQILGVLVTAAKKNSTQPKAYYALGQLTEWMNALLDRQSFNAGRPFALDCLMSVLARQDSAGSLLNTDLQKLRTTSDSILLIRMVKTIMQTQGLPHEYKKKLFALVLSSKVSSETNLNDLLSKLNTPNQTPGQAAVLSMWLDMFELTGLSEAEHLEIYRQMIAISQTFAEGELKSAWNEYLCQYMQVYLKKPSNIANMEQWMQLNPSVQMVAWAAMTVTGDEHKQENLSPLIDYLTHLDDSDLKILIKQYKRPIKPNIDQLNTFFYGLSGNNTRGCMDIFPHEFEANIQAGRKRNFDFDVDNFLRVLTSLKLKGQGYVEDKNQIVQLFSYLNVFSVQNDLKSKKTIELTQGLNDVMRRFRTRPTLSEQLMAEALAYMREIVFRNTGKWINQTQTTVLIYAALHPDQSMLHQIHTGEGKSILTAMRVAFRALSGQMVDVCSSSDALISRDHEAFSTLFDDMGIRHAEIYLTDASSVSDYYTRCTENGVGAIHYSSLSQLGLWFEKFAWEGQLPFDRKDPKRAIYLDEADAVIIDQRAVLNLAPSINDNYNLDEWVYRIVDDFYKDCVEKSAEGTCVVSRHRHLEPLFLKLKHAAEEKKAPDGSPFYKRYIRSQPLSEAEGKQCYSELLRMLSAVHHAARLKPNEDFCVVSEDKILYGEPRQVRSAKVILNQQIAQGSTYSNLVHQFLHLRLNKDAVQQGEAPNFVIDPESQIVLSMQPQVLLQNFYNFKEGCTGTAGNQTDVNTFKALGFDSILKVTTHRPKQTQYLQTSYVSSSDYIDTMIDRIIAVGSRPVLLICDSDAEVLRISQEVTKKLKEINQTYQVLVDTNDSGTPQAEILAQAAKDYCVTVSAKISRGSDISPQNPSGLHVLCTSALEARALKQAYGRTGRQGAAGSCESVIDVDKQNGRWDALNNSELTELRNSIYRDEANHLEDKKNKHRVQNHGSKSSKIDWLVNSNDHDMQENYLKTRTLLRVDMQLQQAQDHWVDCKDKLMTTMSLEFMRAVNNAPDKAVLQKNFADCRASIEQLWEGRLAGKTRDDEATYLVFETQSKILWNNLCDQTNLSKTIAWPSGTLNAQVAPYWQLTAENKQHKQTKDTKNLTEFYQKWAENKKPLSGTEQNLFDFYTVINAKVSSLAAQESQDLLACLKGNVENKLIYKMLYTDLAKVLSVYTNAKSIPYLPGLTKCFEKKNNPFAIAAFVKIMPILITHAVDVTKAAAFIDQLLNVMNKNSRISEQAVENLGLLIGDKDLAVSFLEHMKSDQLVGLMYLLDIESEKINDLGRGLKNVSEQVRTQYTPLYLYTAQRYLKAPSEQAPHWDAFEACLLDRTDEDKYQLESQWMQYLMRCESIEEAEYLKFIEKLGACSKEEQTGFLYQANRYPPFIPMGYVCEVCFPDNSSTNYHAKDAENLEVSAKIYYQFLVQQKIVTVANPIDKVNDTEKLRLWNDYFTQMPIPVQQIFFQQMISHGNLQPEFIQALAQCVINNKFQNYEVPIIANAINLYNQTVQLPDNLSGELKKLINESLPCAQSVKIEDVNSWYEFLRKNSQNPNPTIVWGLIVEDGQPWYMRLKFPVDMGKLNTQNPFAACMAILLDDKSGLSLTEQRRRDLLAEGLGAYADYMRDKPDQKDKALQELHIILLGMNFFDVVANRTNPQAKEKTLKINDVGNILTRLKEIFPQLNRPDNVAEDIFPQLNRPDKVADLFKTIQIYRLNLALSQAPSWKRYIDRLKEKKKRDAAVAPTLKDNRTDPSSLNNSASSEKGGEQAENREPEIQGSSSKIESPIQSEEELKACFINQHKALYTQQKAQWDGFFRRTVYVDGQGHLDYSNMNLTEILQHAIKNNNRSRQACSDIKWLDLKGNLIDTAPQHIKDLFNNIQSTSTKKP